MNNKGMDIFTAVDGVSDEMLLDALPPGMGAYRPKEKSHRVSRFFEHPWVAAAISAAVALAVLSGIVWAGQQAGGDIDPSENVAGNSSDQLIENTYPSDSDKWPDYDNPPVPEDAKVVISSGGYTVAPEEYIQWKLTWNAEHGTLTEERGAEQWHNYLVELDSGADVTERVKTLYSLPCVPYDLNSFTVNADSGIRFLAASAYDESFRHAYSANLDGESTGTEGMTLADFMEKLSPGSYYILLTADKAGTYIESVQRYETTMYEFLFAVDIFETANTTLPTEPPVELPLEYGPVYASVMGVEVWAGTDNATYLSLQPYVLMASVFDDEQSAWQDQAGYGLSYRLAAQSDPLPDLPTVIYNRNFRLFTKTLFKSDDEREYQVEFTEYVIYDQDGTQRYVGYDVTEDLYMLSTLPTGIYYVVVGADQVGRIMEKGWEKGCYEYGFKLIIPGETAEIPGDHVMYNDVFIISDNREVRPTGRNEWTKDALVESLDTLPAAHDAACDVIYPDQSYSMGYLRIYKADGDTLTSVDVGLTDTDLGRLMSLDEGLYCVAFTAQHPDKSEDGTMLARDYAFLLYVGYTWQEADTIMPDEP